jgi:hypothetical protein
MVLEDVESSSVTGQGMGLLRGQLPPVKPAAQRDEVMQMLFPIGRTEPVEDRVYDVDDPTLGSSGPA